MASSSSNFSKTPFKYIEPDIWQIPALVLIQALVAFGANLAGWSIDPVSFFFIPIMLAILFWKSRSFDIIENYFGFNTKNIIQKVLSLIVGGAMGVSMFLILKYSRLSLIPYATYTIPELATMSNFQSIITNIINSLPIILVFSSVIIFTLAAITKKIKATYAAAIVLTLCIPFAFTLAQPIGVINMIIGFGEEILCLIFAMIALNWLVYKFNMKYNSIYTHLIAWTIARASWAVIHALSTYGFVLGAYLSAFTLGMMFTLIGYMFWYRELAIPVLSIFGIIDIVYWYMYGFDVFLYAGVILLFAAIMYIIDKDIFRDNSLTFKEYVIYGAAMAHAMYDLSFVIFA